MFVRSLGFILITTFALWVAHAYTSNWGWHLLSVSLAGLVWMALDSLRANRVLRWLGRPEEQTAPALKGFWGELVERVQKKHKKDRLALTHSDQRLTRFLDAIQVSPNGVLLMDAQGRIEWLNRTAAQHLGLDSEQDLGQYLRNLMRSPDFLAYIQAGDYSQSVEIDARLTQIDGSPIRISIRLHAYGEGRSLLLSRDVTALQLAEAMRRDFVANVSHEIRTPLTVLSGFVETLQSLKLTEEEQRRYLALMASQAGRMQTLVSDLLTLSKLESSPQPGAGELMGAQGLLEQLQSDGLALSNAIYPNNPHRITLARSSHEFEISGIASEIFSAFGNLVSNAVRYSPAGSQIEIGWALQSAGDAVFHVKDHGPGIAPEHLGRLTERFYRVDRSRSRESGGTGLGLAIVKHIAQRHGVKLSIESQVGQGSCFSLQWPASRVREVTR